MYCSNCGKEIPNDADFCPNCGAKQNRNIEEQINEVKNKANNFSKKIDGEVEQAVGEVLNDSKSTRDRKLKTDRSIIILILLSSITCGIYWFYTIYNLSLDINQACEGDGDRTPGLGTYIILSFITCGLYIFYWEYKIANRIQKNASKYNLNIQENGTTVLMWRLFGYILCVLGTYFGVYILFKNANAICDAYNKKHNL